MNFLSIDEVQDQAMLLFRKIPGYQNIRFYVSFIENTYDCMPFVEIDNSGYHLKCYERGKLIQDDVTFDVNELLYWIFQDVTFEEACLYELAHREKYKDNRRLMFAKNLELLGYISEDFVNRRKAHIREILKSSPFDDRHSSIFDLIDDFEGISRALKDIPQKDYHLSQGISGKIVSVITQVEELHRNGTPDILGFCKGLSKIMESVYLELKGVTIQNKALDIEKDRLRGVLAKAKEVLDEC